MAETATPVETFSAAWNAPITCFDQGALDNLIGAQGDFSLEFWHSIPLTPVSQQHPFTYSSGNPLIGYADINFAVASNIIVTLNDTVMHTVTTPPPFSAGWRHVSLTYTQPYAMNCQGAGFEVLDGSGFNFERDFSIAMTFAVTDIETTQGLLYKGTGADIGSPQLQTSYRVTVSAGTVNVDVYGADGSSYHFVGPPVSPTSFYQLMITKQTDTPLGKSDTASPVDPYAPPFSNDDINNAIKGGQQAQLNSDGSINIGPPSGGNATQLAAMQKFNNLTVLPSNKSFSVTIAVRVINTNGTMGAWNPITQSTLQVAPGQTLTDNSLMVYATGSAHLLIGGAYDDSGSPLPLGNLDTGSTGQVRELHLFGSAVSTAGIRSGASYVDIDAASFQDLQGVGLVGYWKAAYDPNGIVNNLIDSSTFAVSSNGSMAQLIPLTAHEYEGTALYVNGSLMDLAIVTDAATAPSSGTSFMVIDAGIYRIQEISFWNMVRQPYQVIDDMFGQLVVTNEPFLTLYIPGSFEVLPPSDGTALPPLLPMAKYIEDQPVANQAAYTISLSNSSLDLQGCPAIGKCGPLITPNLYTPPGVALTVCDTVPDLTTYSMSVNSTTGTLAGEVNEAYVFVRNHVLTVYAGKKVGDLALVWVSQEQGDVQILGYIEGAPPAPMANLTNKPTYAGATSVSFNAPISLSYKYQANDDSTTTNKGNGSAGIQSNPTGTQHKGNQSGQGKATTTVDSINVAQRPHGDSTVNATRRHHHRKPGRYLFGAQKPSTRMPVRHCQYRHLHCRYRQLCHRQRGWKHPGQRRQRRRQVPTLASAPCSQRWVSGSSSTR